MTPGDFGIVAGSTLASFIAGLVKGKRTHNGNESTQNGNGHFNTAWAKTVDKRLDVLGVKMDAIGEDLTNLRIDLGAKR